MSRYSLSGQLAGDSVRFDLDPGTHILGRTADCDIPIPDAAISRHHAEVVVEDDKVLIRDLKSLNGTFVNGDALRGEIELKPRAQIRIGQVTLTLMEEEATPVRRRFATQETAAATLTTTFKEIVESARQSRSDGILAAVSEAGQMLSKSMNPDEIYENVLDLLENIITCSRILILEGDPETGENAVVASRVHDTAPDEPLQMSSSMLSEIMTEGRSFLTSDAATDENWEGHGSIVKLGVHAAMGAPLFDHDRILGAMYLDSRMPGVTYQAEDLRLLTILANMVAVKITNSHLEQEERKLAELRQELSMASRIQQNLLPSKLPDMDGYDIFAHQTPCEDIGGDLYDVRLCQDGRVWLVLGDVTGHGIGAALLMSNVMAGLQILEDQCLDPLTLVARLEAYLGQHVELGQFVTMFAAILDPNTGRLLYVNAGQNPPVLLKNGDKISLPATGVPVAVLPGSHIRSSAECILEPQDTLVVYSDGISEFSAENIQYDEGRMQIFLDGAHKKTAEDLGESLLSDLTDFAAGETAGDDLTLLVIKRT